MSSFPRHLFIVLILIVIFIFVILTFITVNKQSNNKQSNNNCQVCDTLTDSNAKKMCMEGCYLDKCFKNCNNDKNCMDNCMNNIKKENYYDTDLNPYKLKGKGKV